MAKKVKPLGWVAIVAIVFTASWYYQGQGELYRVSVGEPLTEAVVQSSDYEVLDGCVLVDSHRNDGDSFLVDHAEGETEFRLYYVDSPESKFREYSNGENNGKRIHDQGRYFDGLSRSETTAIGKKAQEFVRELLREQPFRVVTKWEKVFSPKRRYAFVIVRYHGKGVYLHELLVAQGLARIHTKPALLPSGRSTGDQIKKLKGLEAAAKNAQLGGWAE